MLGSRCREMVVSWYTGRLWVVVKEKKKKPLFLLPTWAGRETGVSQRNEGVSSRKKKTKGIIIEKLSVW